LLRLERQQLDSMANKTLPFGRFREPNPVDYLALFPLEASVRPAASMFPPTANTISKIQDFRADPPTHEAGGVPCPDTGAPAAPFAASTPWLVCLGLFVPPLATFLLLRTPLLPAVATHEDLAADVTVATTAPSHTSRNVEGFPQQDRPPSILLGEAEAIVTEAPIEVSPNPLRQRPRVRNISRPAQAAQDQRVSNTDPAVPRDRRKFLGSISVASEPAGAQVLIDGEPVGMTPFQSELTAGAHVVRVELDGYTRWSAGIQVITAKTLSVVANLQPAQPQE
jgi:hypothetical protein